MAAGLSTSPTPQRVGLRPDTPDSPADSTESLDEIVTRMQEMNWPGIVLGAVASLASPAISVATEAISRDPTVVPSLVSAISDAYGQAMTDTGPDSPLAFAALAQRKFAE